MSMIGKAFQLCSFNNWSAKSKLNFVSAERMCAERVEQVRAEYDQILQQKLSEQVFLWVFCTDCSGIKNVHIVKWNNNDSFPPPVRCLCEVHRSSDPKEVQRIHGPQLPQLRRWNLDNFVSLWDKFQELKKYVTNVEWLSCDNFGSYSSHKRVTGASYPLSFQAQKASLPLHRIHSGPDFLYLCNYLANASNWLLESSSIIGFFV